VGVDLADLIRKTGAAVAEGVGLGDRIGCGCLRGVEEGVGVEFGPVLVGGGLFPGTPVPGPLILGVA